MEGWWGSGGMGKLQAGEDFQGVWPASVPIFSIATAESACLALPNLRGRAEPISM